MAIKRKSGAGVASPYFVGSVFEPELKDPDTADIELTGIKIDGGGGPIAAGFSGGDIAVREDSRITDVTLLAEPEGSIVIDIWVVDYNNYPPDASNSICGEKKPTITDNIKSHDNVLDGWDTHLQAGDTIRYYVESCSKIKECTVTLKLI